MCSLVVIVLGDECTGHGHLVVGRVLDELVTWADDVLLLVPVLRLRCPRQPPTPHDVLRDGEQLGSHVSLGPDGLLIGHLQLFRRMDDHRCPVRAQSPQAAEQRAERPGLCCGPLAVEILVLHG